MEKILLYNTLSRKKEEFKSTNPNEVGLYTCGPTVYNYAHIGNLRSYLFEDFLKRVLLYNGYKVKHVMNITDVGHLTGDMNMGEDKMEKGAREQGKSAWDLAEFYTASFQNDLKSLNIIEPDIWSKATDHIEEQIALIKILEEKGYTYKTSDGIYYDTSKFKDYNKLSHLKLEELKEGARVEKNEEKKNPTDFALWKFSHPKEKRQMEWSSPWGIGFPGWHIECSAMSLKYLNNSLDIHCGGMDHINIHHTNEIAQSEAATGRPFFNFWLHGAFLILSGGKKMAKSEGNFLTINKTFLENNINPLAYRYACLQVHYRKPMEYSETAIMAALKTLNNLYKEVAILGRTKGKVDKGLQKEFLACINDDLNLAQALAILQKTLKAKLDKGDKLATILNFDQVLGLRLDQAETFAPQELLEKNWPEDLRVVLEKREEARKKKDWAESDKLRLEAEFLGYSLEDSSEGVRVFKK